MPSLQIDLPVRLTHQAKSDLARDLGALYADVMDVQADIITVVVRDSDEGNVWRCTEGEPEPAGLVIADIREGRPTETRARLAERIVETCGQVADLHPHQLKVEFTQHPGDDMYHPHLGGFNRDWDPDERQRT